MSRPTDAGLYLRGSDTLLASWEAYARGAVGAAVKRLPGVAAAVFPHEPERDVYNNALLEPDLGPGERSDALDAMEAVYAAAGITRFAAWVHETDPAMRAGLDRIPEDGQPAARFPRARRPRRLPPAGRPHRRRDGRGGAGVRLRRRQRHLQRRDGRAGPAARAGHRADRRAGARRARPGLPDREPAVNRDGRAHVRRRGFPRPRPHPGVRFRGRTAMMSEIPFVVGDADAGLAERLDKEINSFNAAATGHHDGRMLSVAVRGDDGDLLAG